MAEPQELARSIWNEIHTARTSAEAIGALGRVDQAGVEGGLPPPEGMRLVHLALRRLKDLTAGEPAQAGPLILDRLLPLCLGPQPPSGSEERQELRLLRTLLAEWIETLEEPGREPLRSEVLAAAARGLQLPDPEAACLTIAAIGFRSDAVAGKLWELAAQEGDTGDTALGTLAALGIPGDEHPRFLELLNEKLATRPPRPLLYSLQEAAGPDTLGTALGILPQPESSGEPRLETHLALSMLARVADSSPEDDRVQDRIWDTIRGYWPVVYLAGGLAERCDSERVVPDLLQWLGEKGRGSNSLSRVAYHRLEECVRPRQLRGWEHPDARAPLPWLRLDACQDTKQEGRWSTSEAHVKRMAWETTLCLGAQELVEWIEEAVLKEANPYVQERVLEAAACLAVPSLPGGIARLITEEYDAAPRDESGGMFPRVGAIRLAHSAATWEAFEALLNFGLTHDGQVLLSTADALADVSVTLAHSGNPAVVETLFAAALADKPTRRRAVAVRAIRDLANDRLLGEEHAAPLARLAADSSLDSFSRGQALEALAFFPRGSIRDVIGLVKDSVAASGDEELAWRLVELVARHGLLFEESQEVERGRLALARSGSAWTVAEGAPTLGWQAFIIGQLYVQDPDSLAPAVACVIQRADADAVYQILHAVTSHGPRTPTVVVDALVERIRSRLTRYTAETVLFEVLAKAGPTRLVREPWEKPWEGWHPEARIAFADALGVTPLPAPDLAGRAAALLTALLGDGTFAVRRAAARSLASLRPQALKEVASAWAGDPSVAKRKRAAECLGWLPEGGDGLRDLLADPEPSVRAAAKRVLQERRDRQWAAQYLDRVLAVRGPGNEAVLSAYRYGRALARIGDDRDQRRLQQHLARERLPLHVGHWISRIAKEIDDRWRGVTREWPEPWLGWEGTVEELDGEVSLADGRSWPAHFSLWRRASVSPSAKGDWGGAVFSEHAPRDLPFTIPSEINVRVSGRRPARAMVKTLGSDGILILLGNGDYPSPDESPP